MITLEAVRAAVLSELPSEKLDDLVRAEMAGGRRVKDIAADFAALANDVWETPSLSDDGQDAFGDTYDALAGNTHSDRCYYDPPAAPINPARPGVEAVGPAGRVEFAPPPESSPALTPPG
ncbi:MAG TPA: hypothetical protein VD866_08050 [Urbifossiella sp.]|nr:hypothetical protein [Urbifossiella sp.]